MWENLRMAAEKNPVFDLITEDRHVAMDGHGRMII